MTVEFYKARDGYRWRLRAGNNRIVAVSSEAYARRQGAEHAFWTSVVVDLGEATSSGVGITPLRVVKR